MQFFIILFLILIALEYIVEYYYISIPIIVSIICLGIYVSSKENRREERRRQEKIHDEVENIRKKFSALSSQLPRLIAQAEKGLNSAESEFNEGVYPAFWTEVERSAEALATYDNDIRQLSQYAQEFAAKTRDLNVTPAHLLSPNLPNSSNIVDRLDKVTRQAQKDPDFAAIYEMRRRSRPASIHYETFEDILHNIESRLQASIKHLTEIALAAPEPENVEGSHDLRQSRRLVL